MKTDSLRLLFLLLLFFTIGIASSYAQKTISGKVLDTFSKEPLIGANVLIQGTSIGTVTENTGMFSLSTDIEYPIFLEFSYTGYKTKILEVKEGDDNFTISLDEDVIMGIEIVISASRRQEKAQNAPASTSILYHEEIQQSGGNINPLRSLVNTPGVQIQHQSADATNITMRGNAQLYTTSVFPILDYRSLIAPGSGSFNPTISPLNALDMERIEIVRGPASALYGPGVVSGVVHFISKSPIDHPGTSFEVVGGELATLKSSIRHAWKNKNDKFGYKLNAGYKRGDEFTLDGTEGTLAADGSTLFQIDKFADEIVSYPVDPETNLPDFNATPQILIDSTTLHNSNGDGNGNVMQDYYWSAFANATLEFRPKEDMSIITTGGWNQGSVVLYNGQGEGLQQNSEYYGQVRFRKGGLFAQAYLLHNDGGN